MVGVPEGLHQADHILKPQLDPEPLEAVEILEGFLMRHDRSVLLNATLTRPLPLQGAGGGRDVKPFIKTCVVDDQDPEAA